MTDPGGAHDADAKVGSVTDPGGPAIDDSALPGKSDAGGWRRLHPLSPLLRGGIVLLVVLGIVVANFRDHFVDLFFGSTLVPGGNADIDIDIDASSGIVELFQYLAAEGLILLVLGAVIGVVLLIILFSWISWRFSTYRISSEAVETRSGVLFRTHRRAPLERIQSVNLQRSLLARLLGLTKIEVLTAGQDGKVELAFLGYRDAKGVREQIIARATARRREKAGQDPAGFRRGETAQQDPAESGPEPSLVPAPVGPDGYPLSQDSDRLTAHVNDFIDADIDPAAVAENAIVKVTPGKLIASILLGWDTISLAVIILASLIAAAVVEPTIGFAVIPLVIAGVGVIFGQFNKGFNFVLSRGRDAARTGSGLTSTVTETIPFGRIHAIEARQPLLWRPFGWWRARITTAGHSIAQAGQSTTQNVVLPVGSEDDVLRVLETLVPGIGDGAGAIAELRDGLSGNGEQFVGAGRHAAPLLWFGRRRAGIRIAEGEQVPATLQVRRGALTRSLSVMPIVRAQSVQLSRPFIHRVLGLASVQAHTVLGPVRMHMRGLELERARAFFDELAATVLRVQGDDV